MANRKTFYEVLGVARDAHHDEIGVAYRRLRTGMQHLNEPDPRRIAMAKVAYDMLSDPERRAEYDASLEEEGQT